MSSQRKTHPFTTSKCIKDSYTLSKKFVKNYERGRTKGRKTSWVWKWYKEVQNVDDCSTENTTNAINDLAICIICQNVIVRLPKDKKSPKKLITHLSKNHGIVAKKNANLKSSSTNCESNDFSVQEEEEEGEARARDIISGFVNTNHIHEDNNQRKQETEFEFHKLLLNFLIKNDLSFSYINSSSFQDLITFLNPECANHLKKISDFTLQLFGNYRNSDKRRRLIKLSKVVECTMK